MISSDSEFSDESVPEEIREAAKVASLNLLPDKSRQKYTAQYNAFKKWRSAKGIKSYCEDVLLVYFTELAITYSPASLWAVYSMLRSTISAYNDVDMSTYAKLRAFLKKKATGYRPKKFFNFLISYSRNRKKSLIFTKENISKFLYDAPDEVYLCEKAVLIFGIAGALRRVEFVKLTEEHVRKLDDEDSLLVRIIDTKNNVPRVFTINGVLFDICWKYIQLRPTPCSVNNFFLRYANGKCYQQSIGINKFATIPRDIAKYLNLPDADKYTGHAFRRTSATLLVDAGADLTTLQRHGGWKSGSVAFGYIADSMNNKRKICEQISSGIQVNKKSKTTDTVSSVTGHSSARPSTSGISVTVNFSSRPSTSGILTNKNQRQTQRVSNLYTLINNNLPVGTTEQIFPALNENQQVHQRASSAIPILQNKNVLKDNSNVSIDIENENSTENQTPQHKPMFKPMLPVYYHPDIGLYVSDLEEKNVDNRFVFNNCNVTVNCSNGSCLQKMYVDKAVQTKY